MSELNRYRKKVLDQQKEIRELNEKIEGMEEVNGIASAYIMYLAIQAGDVVAIPRGAIAEELKTHTVSVTTDQDRDQYLIEVRKRE